MKSALLLFPFFKWRNWGLSSCRNLPLDKQVESSWAGIWPQTIRPHTMCTWALWNSASDSDPARPGGAQHLHLAIPCLSRQNTGKRIFFLLWSFKEGECWCLLVLLDRTGEEQFREKSKTPIRAKVSKPVKPQRVKSSVLPVLHKAFSTNAFVWHITPQVKTLNKDFFF